MLLSIGFGLLVGGLGYPMLPIYTVGNWYWILLTSAILPFIANLGDFAFSAIKRHFEIKDYSKILGPHGGILDRLDSTIFGAMALMILVQVISNNWKLYA